MLDATTQGEVVTHLLTGLLTLGYDDQNPAPPLPSEPDEDSANANGEEAGENADELDPEEEALQEWRTQLDEEEEERQQEWLQGVITDYFKHKEKEEEEEEEEERRRGEPASSSSTTVARAIATAPWRRHTREERTPEGGMREANENGQEDGPRNKQPPHKKQKICNPELEEAQRVGEMLANPEPGQPTLSAEDMRQDLSVLLQLFQMAQRRIAGEEVLSEKERNRGKQACAEAMEMITELMDMVNEGLDKEHYRQLLWQIRARGNTCRETYRAAQHQYRGGPEEEEQEEEGNDRSRRATRSPNGRKEDQQGNTAVHPADVIALQNYEVEERRQTGQVSPGELLEARGRLCNLAAFMEEPIATELREAIRAIDRWMSEWWGTEETIQIIEDSQDGRGTEGRPAEREGRPTGRRDGQRGEDQEEEEIPDEGGPEEEDQERGEGQEGTELSPAIVGPDENPQTKKPAGEMDNCEDEGNEDPDEDTKQDDTDEGEEHWRDGE